LSTLDLAAVSAADPTSQHADIVGLADHLRDALWKFESAGLAPVDSPAGLIVAGMGGSAVGGRLACAAIGDRASRPIVLAGGYELPPWVDSRWTVLCSSYSGGTEETLALYDAAGRAGAHRVVTTTGGELAERARADGLPVIPIAGGFQPRAAVGYALVSAMEVAALCGAAPSLRDEIEAAAVLAGELAQTWGPETGGEAKELAQALHGSTAVVCGSQLTTPVAYRWKTQLNENAKVHAFASDLPELDHNEIEGWHGADQFTAVFLEDPEQHPRVRRRVEVTADIISRSGSKVRRVTARGETRTERLASLVLLGDLVSLYVAVLRGVDPVEISLLNEIKSALATS
jgi:glucose/mannose-6-phosphate isomerase